jgi:hypothetical protein
MNSKISYICILILGIIFCHPIYLNAEQSDSSLILREKFNNLVRSVNHFQFSIAHFKNDRTYISKNNLSLLYNDCVDLEKQNEEIKSLLGLNVPIVSNISPSISFCQKIKVNFLDLLDDEFTLKSGFSNYQNILNTLEDVIHPYIGSSITTEFKSTNYLQLYAEAIVQKEGEIFELDLQKREKTFRFTVIDETPLVTTSGTFTTNYSVKANELDNQAFEIPIENYHGIIKKCISKSITQKGDRVSTVLYTNNSDCSSAN